jgi:hypothetical protein
VDATCAKVARSLYVEGVTDLGLSGEMVEDGILMASELAANTLHARGCGGGGQQDLCDALPGCPELWLYLRSAGPGGAGQELVCKVFDRSTGWLRGVPAPGKPRPPETVLTDEGDGENGRGLQVVHELSGGHWGYHLSRGRLGGASGKTVWFAQSVPDMNGLPPGVARFPAQRQRSTMTATEAVRELQTALEGRGFTGRLVRADDPAGDMSVLSVSDGLAVWCRAGVAWLRVPGREGLRWPFGDLVEVAEQAVRVHEELGHDRPQRVAAEASR